MTSDFVAEAARRLAVRYKTSGTWLLGFSQGCAMAYYTGIRYPALFQGIICFANGFDTLRFTDAEYAAARELKVFSSHGKEDRVVEYAYGISSRDFLKRHGFKVTVADFKGGHTVPAEPLRQAIRWMSAK